MVDHNKEIQLLNRKIEKLEKKLIQSEKQRDRNNNLFEKLTEDIEEQKKSLEGKNQELKLIQYGIDNARDSICFVDPSTGEILDSNVIAYKSLGLEKEDLIGKKFWHYDINFLPENWTEFVDKLKNGENIYYESIQCTVEEELIPIDINASYFEYQGAGYIVAFIHDISERKAAEAVIIDSKNKTEAILSASTNGIITINEMGLIETFNPAAEKIFGYSFNEIKGKNVSTIMPEEHSSNHNRYIQNYLKTGIKKVIDKRLEISGKRKNGEIFPIEIGISEVKLEKGKLFTAIISDITERKRVERELLLTRFGIDNAGDAVWWIEPETARILQANETAWNTLEYSKEEFLKMSIPQVDPYFPPEKWPPLVEHLKSGNTETFESRHRKKNGDVFPTEINARYITYEDTAYIVAFSRDITERKKAEELLRAAKNEAEAATEAKSKFLATMSHEIRNPMNAIIGLTHLALGTELDLKQKDYISKAHASSKNLLGIINDILDFSKIEAGKLDIETIPFDLFKVMDDIRDVFIFKTDEKGIGFNITRPDNVPQYLLGDPLRIGQILTNFVSNAIKFTANGSVTINAELINGDDEKAKLKLSVTDTGLGMTPEQVGKMFKSFSQADKSTSRKFGGTGLGLSITKHLAELMQGEVGVESEQGKGSTFYFIADFGLCHDTSQFEMDESDLTPTSFEGVTVLLAEDNEINQQVASEIMKGADVEVVTADNGKIALDKVKESSKYHLLFMDLQMPEMDGLTATREIRKLKENSKIPIVAMSADVMEGVREECLKAGMNDFITKPIEPKEVFEMINKWVDLSKIEAEPRKEKEKKDEEEVEAQLPEVEGIDIVEGLKRVGNNKKLYLSLLEKFCNSNRNFREELEKALQNKDAELSERIVHTLKGVSGNLGIKELHEECKVLESVIKEDISNVAKEDIDRVENLLNPVLASLNEKLSSSDEKGGREKVKLDDVKNKLAELRVKLEDYDSDAGKLIEEIGIIEGYEKECNEISEMVKNYEFDEALEIIKKINS